MNFTTALNYCHNASYARNSGDIYNSAESYYDSSLSSVNPDDEYEVSNMVTSLETHISQKYDEISEYNSGYYSE